LLGPSSQRGGKKRRSSKSKKAPTKKKSRKPTKKGRKAAKIDRKDAAIAAKDAAIERKQNKIEQQAEQLQEAKSKLKETTEELKQLAKEFTKFRHSNKKHSLSKKFLEIDRMDKVTKDTEMVKLLEMFKTEQNQRKENCSHELVNTRSKQRVLNEVELNYPMILKHYGLTEGSDLLEKYSKAGYHRAVPLPKKEAEKITKLGMPKGACFKYMIVEKSSSDVSHFDQTKKYSTDTVASDQDRADMLGRATRGFAADLAGIKQEKVEKTRREPGTEPATKRPRKSKAVQDDARTRTFPNDSAGTAAAAANDETATAAAAAA